MNYYRVLLLLLFLSLVLETTVISFPLVYVLSLLLYILYPEARTIVAVLFVSMILDTLKVTPIGKTSIVVFVSFFVLDWLKHIFEIKDYKIIILILFTLSFLYAKTFSYTDSLLVYVLLFGGAVLSISYFAKKPLW